MGIRPCIDGRRKCIRESLEEQTMAMANATKELISKNIRHPNSKSVEVIIVDTTIGGVKEAVACQNKIEKEGI